jgi:flagellar assembly factor FliW
MRLCSTEQAMLAFVVLPVPAELRVLADADCRAVCDELVIGTEELLLLLMVTLNSGPSGLAAFANLRAPLFVDTERRLGWQVVLPSRAYPIRYPLRVPG